MLDRGRPVLNNCLLDCRGVPRCQPEFTRNSARGPAAKRHNRLVYEPLQPEVFVKTLMLVLKPGGLGGNHDLLAQRLLELSAEFRGAGAWIVRTNCSIDDLRSDLGRFLHPHDQILIVELAAVA
jgi:hypothetical protein